MCKDCDCEGICGSAAENPTAVVEARASWATRGPPRVETAKNAVWLALTSEAGDRITLHLEAHTRTRKHHEDLMRWAREAAYHGSLFAALLLRA